MKKTVDVVIPSYKPGEDFEKLLKCLNEQNYPIQKILVMNTEERYWKKIWEKNYSNLEVHHLSRKEFDHAGTRKQAAALAEAEILVYMTQDAIPANKNVITALVHALEQEENVAAAYARQLPKEDCNFLECYTRSFNYPEKSIVKWKKDIPKYGIKTFFCSNVCAAYKREIFIKTGGFVEKAIFNEDMIYAGKLIQLGYGVAYAADAEVLHSHNYSAMQQFHRNFDLGVSQAEHPEIFSGIRSEGEGIALVKRSMRYLLKSRRPDLIFSLILQSACKYAGYLAGKNYKKLPRTWVLKFTMMPAYWE